MQGQNIDRDLEEKQDEVQSQNVSGKGFQKVRTVWAPVSVLVLVPISVLLFQVLSFHLSYSLFPL